MAISKAKRSAAAKKAARTRKRNAAAKLQKAVQPQGEESALPVVRRKAALREKPLRERAALRNEEGNQSFRLKYLFFIFFNY